MLVREQKLLSEVLTELRKLLPFDLLGFDTDNDSVFMNETVRDYCQEAGIEFTRCRPYRKNDQAFVEQKNGAIVRRIVGYRRLEGLGGCSHTGAALSESPVVRELLPAVVQVGGEERARCAGAQTPSPAGDPEPTLAGRPRTPAAVRDRVTALKSDLDSVRLLAEIRAAQQRLVALADKPMTGDAPPPTLEVFLAGLRTAWKEGEVRPTTQPAVKAVRWWRSRRDPFETTWPLLRQWFDAEPERTGRELFERLQAEHPGVYPDRQLRTLQRRLEGWRREAARRLVFATPAVAPGLGTGAEVPYAAVE